jgi:hypothetical protein
LLAAQSMAVNTNSQEDSGPFIEASPSVRLAISTSNVFPIVAPFEAAPATQPAAEAQPAAIRRRPSIGKRLLIFAAIATLIATAVFALQAGMSRTPRLQHHAVNGISRSAIMMRAPGAAKDTSDTAPARQPLPQAGLPAPMPRLDALAAPAASGALSWGERGDFSASSRDLPGLAAGAPPATASASPPPAPSPQSLNEAIVLAAGANPGKAPASPVAAAPEAAATPDEGGFNRVAAQASLRAITGTISSCKPDPASTGTGAIRVTFVPSGAATNAVVDGASFAGTPAGSCIARLFRGARVPPFAGGPVTVRQPFTIR